jgi:hypothetical protein
MVVRGIADLSSVSGRVPVERIGLANSLLLVRQEWLAERADASDPAATYLLPGVVIKVRWSLELQERSV